MMEDSTGADVDPRLAVRALHALRGPNLWSNSPILEAWVDVGELNDVASDAVPGFNERLRAWLPTLIEHRCSVGERGGFFQRLERGTYPAHILEHIALELQSLAGTPVGYGKARAMSVDRLYRVVVRYVDERLGRTALSEARKLLLAAYDGRDFDVAAALARLRSVIAPARADRFALALLAAAKQRGIPAMHLNDEGLIQLGYCKRQRRVRVRGLLSDATSAVGEEVAQDRLLYWPLFKQAGIPVPSWYRAETPEDAWNLASELGPPVWVVPVYGDFGGDGFELCATREEVERMHARWSEEYSQVGVMRPVEGSLFRFLVIGEAVVAGVRWNGGGVATVIEPESIGREVLRGLIECAACVGLDVAAVTVVAQEDGSTAPSAISAVISIDARPRLAMIELDEAELARVAERVLGHLFAEGSPPRVPLIAIAGGPERGEVAAHVVELLRGADRIVGFARNGYAEVDRRPLPGLWRGLGDPARSLLMNPHLDAVVVEISRRDVLEEGLPFDRCAIGIVTGLDQGSELVPRDWGFEEPEDNLPRAERCVVDVADVCILNGEEHRVASFADQVSGRVVFYHEGEPDSVLGQSVREALVNDHPRSMG